MAVNPENYFTGDGSTTSYNLTFEYIDETDVKVTLDGTLTTAYSFANATTILFDTAPSNDVEIRIYRDTNVDELKSTFFAGSSVRAQDLNQNFEQNNFAVQELKAYSWDNETATIHSDETWVSSDTQIATTAAMDQRFLDEAAETILSTETWVSDDDRTATTAAIDARFQDELSETITSSETWPDNDDTIATTAAIDDRIDTAITNDIGTDGTGITVTDDGDGTITLGLGSGSIDLDRIKAGDIVASGETWANNDTTVATTAMIDDQIDAAITGDILIDSTGLSKSTSGGQTTLGIAAGSVDLDRIKAGDIINLAEQNAGPTTADTSIFTSSAAAKRFDTLVQTTTPSGSDYQVGKTWLQNDDDLTLSIWNGSGWTAVSSGGTFTEQPSVVYVDQASGDNANTGHRISTPKATIKAAIEQINAEIDIEITSGGSGYVEGSYTTVALTGGNGTGLTADITVNASGVVSAVTVNSTTTLEDYSIGDVLSASNADLGGSGSGLQITVTGDGDGQIVIVSAGTYQEVAPIQIKRRNVSVIGQALRSCIVHPTSATELNTLFELNSGSYIANLTLTGMQAGTGTGNTLDAVLPTDQGWNFAFYDNAFITKSPYIQNCTNFSDSEIDNDDLRSHRPRGGTAGDTDSAPTGGGLLVNGATPHDDSPLRSMVADSYTHVALNGPGILVTNNGYTQITSSYAFFNTYHIKCLNGGQANLAASTTDFGDRSLVADGRSTSAIFTSNVDGAANDGATSFNVNQPTAGTGWFGDTQRPAGNMLVEVNSVTYPILSATPNTDSEGGDGWTVTISRPDPNNRSNNLGLNGAVGDDAAVSFFLRSMIASSGHTMEYVGSGTNYSALPENGGVPNEARQITESNNGKVWTAITDHNGKFRIGGNQTDDPIFEVDQQLGFVTIPEGSIAFNLLSDETPQLGGELDANSNKITSLADPTAAQDAATKNYADTKLPLSGGTMIGNTEHGDNIKALFGDSDDLEIFHDGTDSVVKDAGAGVLSLRGDGVYIQSGDGSKSAATFVPDNRAQLMYNGAAKLETTTDGINVTGEVQGDSLDIDGAADISGNVTLHGNLDLQDNDKILLGTGNDLEIHHNGNDSVISDLGTGDLYIKSSSTFIRTGTNESMANFNADGSVQLYHDNSQKLATTSSGINVTGSVTCNAASPQVVLQDNNNTGVDAVGSIVAQDSGGSSKWLVGDFSEANENLYLYNYASADLILSVNNGGKQINFTSAGHFVPADDDAQDLGTSSTQWRNAYFDGTVNCDGLDVDGTAHLQHKVYSTENTATASAFDLNNGNFWTFGAIAVPNPTNQTAGMSGLLRVTAAPTSFAANWNFPGGSYTAPTSFPAVAPFFVQASGTILVGNWTEGIT